MNKEIIQCPHCNSKYTSADLKRKCSNCFACTGCEIYICYHCGEQIIIKAPREMKRSKK